MNEELMQAMRRRLASTSVGPSTARKMGPAGTIKSAKQFLAGIRLQKFAVGTELSFQRQLDKATHDFVIHLPPGARHWGAARKFINIFLRAAVYDRFVCARYDLIQLEEWLELPLDSFVAKGLRRERGGAILPRWKTVIGLSPKENRAYQDFAKEVAVRKKLYRVHLDILYWRRIGEGAL